LTFFVVCEKGATHLSALRWDEKGGALRDERIGEEAPRAQAWSRGDGRRRKRKGIPPLPPNYTFCEIIRCCLGALRLGMVFFRQNPSIFEGERKRPLGNEEVRTDLFEKIPNPFGIFLLSVFFGGI